ncbi:DUF2806 domain-containing protein [Nitrosomonas supralitoralis]|uniref:Uncharacterized protein n=1 Tax=Nitrosomonas supralitoralis TaxID=2116706 RepID=A0A2P7NYL8_9PROT|nr:DUF2806 domain-containing protein [Nitrosomonas supralitoralis]PSJ18581.1 hypothetical protein C7H79_01955 [Nitrosomonas supralitoralis]
MDNANVPSNLTQKDKYIFSVLCQFSWIQGEPLPLIFDFEDEVYSRQGITLPTLRHLENVGLIAFESGGFVKKGLGKHTRLFYCGKPTKIGFQNAENNFLDLGHVLLTARGKELALTVPVIRNQQFYEYVIRRWFEQGLVLSSIQIGRNRKSNFVDSVCAIKEPE